MICVCSVLFVFMPSSPEARKNMEKDKPAYKKPQMPVEQRVADLLERMTLEEKAAQTWCVWKTSEDITDEQGHLKSDEISEWVKNGIGHWARLNQELDPRKGAEMANRVQKFILENNRLGIPVIFHDEGLHGFMAKGATQFPQAIALASTWDPDLIHELFTAVAVEMRSRGVNQALTPVLGLARDPRWGRTEETYGEDPYLVSCMGVACVKAFQGEGPFIDKRHVIATVKHFAVYSQPERGINYSPGNFSERIIRGEFLVPFHAALTEGGALSVMASYNEIDGIPSHANRRLLEDILREEWGFKGFVVADYGGIGQLYKFHFVAHDKYEAARMALRAGVDIELPNNECYSTLVEQIEDGRISETTLDKAVARILKAKFLLGLFDDPYVDPKFAEKITNCDKHREIALKAAQKAVVLLKNEKNLLPLDMNSIKSMAIIGPNAAEIHLGGYSWEPREGISILDGIKSKAGRKLDVLYAEGVKITEGDPLWGKDEVMLADPAVNKELIKKAVETARKCDVAVLVLGGNEATCREGWSREHLGDRNSLEMLSLQNEMVKAVVETGTPTIVMLINGRPLSINYVVEHVPAIIECWYLGQETGTVAADVLFGDCNPGGKLPITFPRSVGHIPAYYYRKPSVVNDYLFASREPLFPFGYGLSYTTFRYDNLRVSPERIGPAGTARVSVDVTNTGSMEGDEVIQMYIRDMVSSVTRPVKELKGFKRITLKPGETRTVTLEVTPDKLSFVCSPYNV